MIYVGGARTNNNVEGWHRSINAFVGCKNPSVYEFLENAIKMQGFQEAWIARIDAGEPPEPGKKIYRDYEARLQRLVGYYIEPMYQEELIRYIRSIASVLSFDVPV